MINNFNYCFTELLKDEGGYSNDPRDSGGATNLGITLADYRTHINPNGTPDDVKKLTIGQAKIIYKNNYWNALDCDNLPSGLDYTVFDYGVNSGVGRAKRILLKFNDLKDTRSKINAINDERMTFLRSLRAFPVYGKGWTRRVNDVRTKSLKLSLQQLPTVSPHVGIWSTISATAAGVWHWVTDHKVLIILSLIFAGVILSTLISYFGKKNVQQS